MFVNQDIALGHSWNGPAAALINDGFPLGMTIPNEGSYGFVYTYNIANNCPNKDNAYTFLNAILASPEIGASMTNFRAEANKMKYGLVDPAVEAVKAA